MANCELCNKPLTKSFKIKVPFVWQNDKMITKIKSVCESCANNYLKQKNQTENEIFRLQNRRYKSRPNY